MRTVYLLRHAKSSWKDAAASDFDRPLNKRGRSACVQLSRYLSEASIAPATILCSGAARTRETLARIAAALPATDNVHFDDDLYLASETTIRRKVRALDDGAESVLVIAHCPGVQDCALAWTEQDYRGERARIQEKFPTGALARVTFDAPSWREIGPGRGAVTLFVRPRDLPPLPD